MADNTTLNSGSGGDTLATDEIGGVKFPRNKLIFGADGTNSGDVSSNNPFPVKPFTTSSQDWTYAAAASGILNTTTAVTFKAAAGASVKNYITAVQVMSEALGTATELAIRDGAGGTVLWRIKIPTTGLINGFSMTFPSPLRGTANTLLEVVTLTASTTGAVYFNAQGYTAP